MATIDVTASRFKEFEVLMPTDDFAPAIASCAIVPAQDTSTWKGGTPDAVFTDVSSPTWTCAMRIAQDSLNADSLFLYLLEHAGETIEGVRFTPIAGGRTWELDLTLAAPQIGGDIDAWAEATMTHAVQGRPRLVTAG